MGMIQLLAVLMVVLFVLKLKKPLYTAIGAGIISAVLLYRISWNEALRLITRGVFQKDTLELILAFLGLNFLQQAMERREQRKGKNYKIVSLFSSIRLNIMVMPFLIGLLPSAGAVSLAAPVVEGMGKEYLSKEEKAFVASYYRHISEMFLPTYSYIILAVNLSGVHMGKFQAAMLPAIFLLFILGYAFYVRKIPDRNNGQTGLQMKAGERVRQLVEQYWAIILLVLVILLGDIPVYVAVFPVVFLFILVNGFSGRELRDMMADSIQFPIMLDTVFVMAFKEILLYTNAFEELPEYLMNFHIPPILVFALLFFVGSLIMGSQAAVAVGIPLAFASIPNGGVGLLVLAVGMVFLASQISPTHVCLSIAVEYFQCSFWDLVKKMLPVVVAYMVLIVPYSILLCEIF